MTKSDRSIGRPALLTTCHHPEVGFRFSLTDGLAIVVCAVLTVSLQRALGPIVWLFPVALSHFFLFCNVFRIARNPEYIWSGCFIMNFIYWNWTGEISWLGILSAQSPITVGLIIREMRLPRYHGVGAHWVNPALMRFDERENRS